jgi:broad specificity phosphatase PhoE
VLTSPRTRARVTAELTGFPDAEVDEDLAEWAYGDYEGITTPEIRESVPGWTVWTHACPGGETAQQVSDRLDRVVKRAQAVEGRTLVFAHGHSLRALTARWLELPVTDGRLFRLDTSTLSVLGFERETPVILRWNS